MDDEQNSSLHDHIKNIPSSSVDSIPQSSMGSVKQSMENQFMRPKWVDDEKVTNCFMCKKAFSLFFRKHHCRACGEIVCNACSPFNIPLTSLGYLGLKRVCGDCFAITGGGKSRNTSKSYYEKPLPPIHRSDIVLFSPPVSPLELTSCDEGEPMSENILRYYDFSVYFEKSIFRNIQVSVSNDRILVVHSEGKLPFRTLFYRDILGLQQSKQNKSVLCIHWFPWVGGDSRYRKETKIAVKFSSPSERLKFYEIVNSLLKKSSMLSIFERREREQKKLLVLINPCSGSGNGSSIDAFNKISHILDLAHISWDAVDLDNTNHAAEILSDSNLGPYFAISCCGGDGLVNVTINALLQRKIDLPVFCIPTGHGIGFSASILAHCSPIGATYTIAKGFRRKLDLINVNIDGKRSLNACLLVAWGTVATVEFDTDSFRWLGPIRYKMGVVAAITNPPLHHLRIEYVPAKDQTMSFCTGEGCKHCKEGIAAAHEKALSKKDNIESNKESESEWIVEEGYFISVTALNLSDSTYNHRIAPYAHASDGCIDLVFIKDISRAGFIDLYKHLKTGSFVEKHNFYLHDKLGYIKVTKFKVTVLDSEKSISIDGSKYTHKKVVECSICPAVVTIGA